MSYMVFSQYTGDTSDFESDLDMARQKFTALGASRMTGSIALTGEAAGSFTVASIWETADGYFDARPQVLADPEISSLMQSRGMARLGTSFAELYAETGTAEGKYAISVVGVAAVHTPETRQAVVEAASNVMQANGVSGMRFTRMIAAGQQSGVYVTIAYADSLDAYIAGSAAAAVDSGFVSALGDAQAQIVLRQFNRMI